MHNAAALLSLPFPNQVQNGETPYFQLPEKFSSQINLNSFFSHAIPLFFPLPPLTSDFSLEPLEIKAAPHFIFAPKENEWIEITFYPKSSLSLSPPCLQIAIRSF